MRGLDLSLLILPLCLLLLFLLNRDFVDPRNVEFLLHFDRVFEELCRFVEDFVVAEEEHFPGV